MILKNKEVSSNGIMIAFLVLISVVAIRNGFVGNSAWYWIAAFVLPILILVIRKTRQTSQPYQRKTRRKLIQKTRRQASGIGV